MTIQVLTAETMLENPNIKQMSELMGASYLSNAAACEAHALIDPLFNSVLCGWLSRLGTATMGTPEWGESFTLLNGVLTSGVKFALSQYSQLKPKKAARSSAKASDPWLSDSWDEALISHFSGRFGQVFKEEVAMAVLRLDKGPTDTDAIASKGAPQALLSWAREVILDENEESLVKLMQAVCHEQSSRIRVARQKVIAAFPAMNPLTGEKTLPLNKSGEVPMVGISFGWASDGQRHYPGKKKGRSVDENVSDHAAKQTEKEDAPQPAIETVDPEA
jgi:hypothetical protein